MKKLSTLYWFIAAATLAALMAACGKSNDGGGPVHDPGVPGVVPPPQVMQGVKIGFFAQNSKMDVMFNNGGSSYVLQQTGMLEILKYAMRTCDRGQYNGGMAACSSYMSGFNDIMIFANGAQASSVQMIIRSMPDTSCSNPYYCKNYWYSLPSFQQFLLGMVGFNTFNNCNMYNPLSLNMTVWPINNSQGFELRGYAPGNDLCYNSGGLLFQFQVAQGKFEDLAWNYQLVFNGHIAATGRMVRCATANCGLQ